MTKGMSSSSIHLFVFLLFSYCLFVSFFFSFSTSTTIVILSELMWKHRSFPISLHIHLLETPLSDRPSSVAFWPSFDRVLAIFCLFRVLSVLFDFLAVTGFRLSATIVVPIKMLIISSTYCHIRVHAGFAGSVDEEEADWWRLFDNFYLSSPSTTLFPFPSNLPNVEMNRQNIKIKDQTNKTQEPHFIQFVSPTRFFFCGCRSISQCVNKKYIKQKKKNAYKRKLKLFL